LPETLEQRRAIAARRVLADVQVLRLAHGELPYFNPAEYAPQYTFATLAAMYRRKALVTGDLRFADVADVAALLDGSRLRFEPGFIESRLLPLLDGEPEWIHDFVRRIGPAQG
jgi:hypothetical protein